MIEFQIKFLPYLELICTVFKNMVCTHHFNAPSPCFIPSLQSMFYTDHNTNLASTNLACSRLRDSGAH